MRPCKTFEYPITPRIAETYVNVALPEAFAFHATDSREPSRGVFRGGPSKARDGKTHSSEAYAEAQRMRGTLREPSRRGAGALRCAGAADSAGSGADDRCRHRRDRWRGDRWCGR